MLIKLHSINKTSMLKSLSLSESNCPTVSQLAYVERSCGMFVKK